MTPELLDVNINPSQRLVSKWEPTSLLDVQGWDDEKKREVTLKLEKTYQFLVSIASFYDESEKVLTVLLPSITRIAKHDIDVSSLDINKLVEIADENIELGEAELTKKIESQYLEYLQQS